MLTWALAYGCDADEADHDGRTALHYAVMAGSAEGGPKSTHTSIYIYVNIYRERDTDRQTERKKRIRKNGLPV